MDSVAYCTRAFVDKLKDMEPAKTRAEAEEVDWQGSVDFTQIWLCKVLFIIIVFIVTSEMNANITKE